MSLDALAGSPQKPESEHRVNAEQFGSLPPAAHAVPAVRCQLPHAERWAAAYVAHLGEWGLA